MGYLDLNAAYAPSAPLDAFTGHATARGEVAEFSPLEWTTILLSRRDRLSSLGKPSRIARFLGRLFGIDLKPRLADVKLEALRRFAVFSWQRGYNVPKSEFVTFRNAGFSAAQAETLLASIAIARADRNA
jgi:hypothetical protein